MVLYTSPNLNCSPYPNLSCPPQQTLPSLCLENNNQQQKQAEQFLSNGFAEVKMRLLAEVVELVMRTHHSLANQGVSGNGNSITTGNAQSFTTTIAGGGGAKNIPLSSTFGGGCNGGDCGRWVATKSDTGGSSRASSPWNNSLTPPPPPHQHKAPWPGSVESNRADGGAGFFTISSPSPAAASQSRCSPPLLYGGPITGANNVCGGGGSSVRHPSASSPSGMSDEQNAPSGMGMSWSKRPPPPQRVPPSSVLVPAPLHTDWNATEHRAFYHGASGGGGGGGAVGGGGGGPSAWVRGPGISDAPRGGGVTPLSIGRSPLVPQSAQGPPIDMGMSAAAAVAVAPAAVFPESPPLPHDGGGVGSILKSDWLAVQQAFGTPPNTVLLRLPPPAIVPTSPPETSSTRTLIPMPKLFPQRRTASSLAAAAEVAAAHEAAIICRSEMTGVDAPLRRGSCVDNGNIVHQHRRLDISAFGEAEPRQRVMSNVNGGRVSHQQSEQGDDASLTEALGKMQRQIEAMLERNSHLLDGKATETEQAIYARLNVLESKVHGLEFGSSSLRSS